MTRKTVWNNRYPNRTATAPEMSLSLCVLPFQQSHPCLNGVALMYNDSKIIPRETCQILRNCQYKWLLVSQSVPWYSFSSSGSPGKFLSHMGKIVSTALPSLVPLGHIDDCSAIRFLQWELCDPLYPSHQNVPLWAQLHQSIPSKKPCSFRLQADFTIWGPAESACIHCAYPNLVPLCARDSIVSSWDDMEKSRLPCFVFRQGSVEVLSSTKFTLNSCANLATHAIYLFVFLLIHQCYFCFRFLWIHAAGLSLHPYFHFFLVLDFWCICRHQIRNLVMKMMEKKVNVSWGRNSLRNQEPQVERCSKYCNQFSCHFCWDVVFWPLVHGLVYPQSSQSFQNERTAGVSSRSITLTNKSCCLTYTVPSSLICTSPLAVISVVGLLDVLMVFTSTGLKSSAPTVCTVAPESSTNSLLWLSCWSTCEDTLSASEKNVALSIALSLLMILERFHALLQAHRCCLSVSSWDRSSNFTA